MIWILLHVSLQLFVAASAQVNTTEFTETSVTVSWSREDYHNLTIQYGVLNDLSLSVEVSAGTSYIIDNLQSAQLYTFRLQGYNKTGDVIFTSEPIYQATKPYPVSNVSVLSATVTSLYITWEDRENTNISYVVVYTDTTTVSQSTNNTFINLTDLKAGHEYSISVFSVAYGIRSNETKPIIVNTEPAPLTELVALNTTTTALEVMWKGGEESSIDFYNLSITPADAPYSNQNKMAGVFSTWFTGLEPGKTYQVTVVSISGTATSKPLHKLFWTVPMAPVISAVTTNVSIIVSWEVPLGQRDNFTVVVKEDNSENTQTVTALGTAVQSSIIGLSPGHNYTIAVTAMAGNQQSIPSVLSPVTTVPNPVLELHIVGTDTDSAIINWTPPTPETLFDRYQLKVSGITSGLPQYLPPDLTSYNVTGLMAGVHYMVMLTTLSGNTESSVSSIALTTKPNPVNEIRVNLTESYYVQIEWELVPQAHGYLVIIVDRSQPDVLQRNPTQTHNFANITDLNPGHQYIVIVQSFVNFTTGVVYSSQVSRNVTTKPLPVVSLEVIASPERITVKWEPNPLPDNHVDEFLLQYRSVLRDPDAAWTLIYTVNVQEDIPDLFPGEKIIVQVISKSVNQLSDVTEADIVIAPEPPTSLTILSDLTTTSSLFIKLEVDRNVTYATGWNITFYSTISQEREITVTDPSSNHIELSKLGSGETFTIQAFSITVDNIRSYSELQANGTVQPVFSVSFTEESTSNSSLNLRYTENPPVFDLYHFQLESKPAFTKQTNEERLVLFKNLVAGQLYSIKSWVSSEEVNSISEEHTFQSYPNKVKTTFEIHSTAIMVSFTKPEGMVTFYNISCYNGEITCGEYTVNATDTTQAVKFDELIPFQDYSFTIFTMSGLKSVQETVSYQTTQTAPSIVRMVTALVVAPNTVVVRWKVPELSNGEITLYTVKYSGKLTGKPDDEMTKNLSTWEIPPTNITLPGLLAGYSYKFSVQAYTLKYGPAGETTLMIPAYPPPFKESLKTEDILPMQEEPPTSESVTLKFVNAFSNKGGEVTTYTVIVSTDNRTEQKTPLLLPGWLTAQNDPAIKAYQAVGNCSHFFVRNNGCHSSARKKRNTESMEFVSFTVGSELGCDKSQKTYCNGPLKADTDYYIALRAFTAGGPSDTPYSKKIRTAGIKEDSNKGAIIGGVVGSLSILALLVAIFLFWRYRQTRPNMYKKEAHEMNEDPHMKRSSSSRTRASRIVKLIDFPEHVQLMSADSDYRFAEEFEELREVGRDQLCNAAELPQNRAKNRFTNILPYDHSRVKLLPTDDEEGSDYINANYMPGYHSRREYIVTQGPLPSTRDDFWRMLWEQNVRNIIMLTRCVEKGREKCDHYWPLNSESMFYGDLQVAILNETKFPDWTVTEFRISLGDNGRKIRHFHYTGWPDFGVPERPQSLVKFVKTVHTKLVSDGGPQIVHCSAGVGRSGTYIALDRLLQHIQHNDWVDPYSIVHEMRCQRVWMVQTEQQYICIHQCLLSVLQGQDEEPIYCNQAHENIGYEDDEGINVEII